MKVIGFIIVTIGGLILSKLLFDVSDAAAIFGAFVGGGSYILMNIS